MQPKINNINESQCIHFYYRFRHTTFIDIKNILFQQQIDDRKQWFRLHHEIYFVTGTVPICCYGLKSLCLKMHFRRLFLQRDKPSLVNIFQDFSWWV